jgi:HB1/ASXL restriction endonuclease-like protein with HTH domain
VSSAIVQVLTEARRDLRVKEIWREVEQLLGESVSRHSIKSYLHHGTYSSKPIFERVRHGRYRLRDEGLRLRTGDLFEPS